MSEHIPEIEKVDLLQPLQWAQFQAMFPTCSYRSTSNTFVWSVVVTEEVWLALKRIPKNSVVDLPIRYHNGDTDATKGPHGLFWNRMHKQGIFSSLDLRQALGIEDADESETKAKLRSVFDVTSMTFVSPETFFQWATERQLHGCAAIARQQSQYQGMK